METKITVLVSEDLRRQAKAAAALQGRSLSDVIREMLEEWLEESLDTRVTERSALRVRRNEEVLLQS
jgi:Arc/MetJ-type ribon-helix-helix transcriptional regulator